jgi:hypothetical protein
MTAIYVSGCLFSSVVFGCRYTVRDAGFVDVTSVPYRLYGYVRDDTPEPLKSAFKQISYAALLDSNVEVEIISSDRQRDHPAMKYLDFWEIQSFPAAILVSPKGQSLVLPISVQDNSFKEAVWSALEAVVSSPKREEISQNIVKAYGVVLLIQGKNADKNKSAEDAAIGAIDDIAQIMDQMPKPAGEPPRLIVIPPDLFVQERVLLWSLGVNEHDVSDPCIAVLYGRGRRIGPLLEGDGITENSLINILSLAGMSCECGLDRAWMLGTMIPLRWNGKIQSEVIRLLGFDAESPMVKREISQILSMGSSVRASAEGPMGFSEGTLDEYTGKSAELEEGPSAAMISPAQFRELSSPGSSSEQEGLVSRILLPLVAGMALLILAGGLLIALRSRRTSL